MKKRSACIIPCLNCEKTIEQIVCECLHTVDSVYVIDDGSTDNSYKLAKRAGAKTIKLEKNQGVSNAIQIGINIASNEGHYTIITLDADGAHNPSDIPKMLITHTKEANVLTLGSRWHGRMNLTKVPSHKWWANLFARYLVNQIINSSLPDVTTGFRVFDTDFAKEVQQEDGFGFMFESIFYASRRNYKIGFSNIDVRYDAREIWLTKHKEFLDFMTNCSKWCDNESLSSKIEEIKEKILVWDMLKVVLNKGKRGKIVLYAHPLLEKGGYIFQQQHVYFSEKLDDCIIL